MSPKIGKGGNRRKRVSGILNDSGRGLSIRTDAVDLWVIDRDEVDSELLGRCVTAEGIQAGYDRLDSQWIGEV
jgi:Protein of unknown function (DUF5818)